MRSGIRHKRLMHTRRIPMTSPHTLGAVHVVKATTVGHHYLYLLEGTTTAATVSSKVNCCTWRPPTSTYVGVLKKGRSVHVAPTVQCP
mmetsp:Transcript_75561/g.244459  ORF Transcript_75561/g.244459 Transcript_75561/m.244459 type:complete len:88 (+) Transcript_75561:60-323(+)